MLKQMSSRKKPFSVPMTDPLIQMTPSFESFRGTKTNIFEPLPCAGHFTCIALFHLNNNSFLKN